MFVVLNVVKAEKNVFKRRAQKRKIAENGLHICRCEKGLPFYILDVLNGKRGINWNTVAEQCGRYSARIIAPKNTALPDDSGLKRFVPVSMGSHFVFNTAVKTIKKACLPPDGFSITLTDRNALHPAKICELLPLASCIRIVTARPERYAVACARALEEFGASLILRSAYEKTGKPDIVICCDGALTAAMYNSAVFAFRKKSGGKILFSGNEISLLQNHRDILPENIDSTDFSGALTELCGCSDYKNAVFSQVEISCMKCKNKEAEKCLKCFLKPINT